MRFETLIAAVLVLSQVAAPVAAQPRDNAASPQFSAAETQTVNRNELLRALIDTDPWLVREILDAVAGRDAKNSEEFLAQALDGIDRATNPDIVSSTRDAAASLEWINLLRRARKEKEAIQGKQLTGRSAKGSIELLEVLRQAQKEKGAAK
jgi:hypothetical protein